MIKKDSYGPALNEIIYFRPLRAMFLRIVAMCGLTKLMGLFYLRRLMRNPSFHRCIFPASHRTG